MGQRGDTSERILELAKELIASSGYNALSYRDLSRQLGITTASIHYHYPEKATLGRAVVQSHHDFLRCESETLLKSDKNALAKLERCFALARGISQKSDSVCLLGILEAEFETYPSNMQQAVRRLAIYHRQMIAHVLEEARRQSVLRFEGDALEQATLVVVAVQGALQLARTLKDPSILDLTLRQLMLSMCT